MAVETIQQDYLNTKTWEGEVEGEDYTRKQGLGASLHVT